MPFQKRKFATNFEHSKFYWKDGITHEVHKWLRNTIGPRCIGMASWDNDADDSQWIFLGTQIRKKHQLHTVTFRFRTKSQAMLFKLTWGGLL